MKDAESFIKTSLQQAKLIYWVKYSLWRMKLGVGEVTGRHFYFPEICFHTDAKKDLLETFQELVSYELPS